MKADLRNIGVIAQKEFADHLYSPGFRILLGIFTLVVLSMSVISGKTDVSYLIVVLVSLTLPK